MESDAPGGDDPNSDPQVFRSGLSNLERQLSFVQAILEQGQRRLEHNPSSSSAFFPELAERISRLRGDAQHLSEGFDASRGELPPEDVDRIVQEIRESSGSPVKFNADGGYVTGNVPRAARVSTRKAQVLALLEIRDSSEKISGSLAEVAFTLRSLLELQSKPPD